MEQAEITGIQATLEEIRTQLADLSARLGKLEARTAPVPAAVNGEPAAGVRSVPVEPPASAEGISEEVLLAISAAVAAFFGERVHIRQIRMIGSAAWAQQGRVSIQASHRLH
jgi:methylmalonyl-CoA carboxyltransferase large subunit